MIKNNKSYRAIILCIVIIFPFLSACRTVSEVYKHPLAEIARLKKIAVIPIGNISRNGYATQIVTSALILELHKTGAFEIANMGELDKILKKSRVAAKTYLTLEQIKKIGKDLGCQAIITGGVEIFDPAKPEVDINLRMIDTESGIIIWMADMGRTGKTDIPTFGIGETSSIKILTQRVIRELVYSMFK